MINSIKARVPRRIKADVPTFLTTNGGMLDVMCEPRSKRGSRSRQRRVAQPDLHCLDDCHQRVPVPHAFANTKVSGGLVRR